MAKYALVSPAGTILEFRSYDAVPSAVTSSATKPRLLPVTLVDVSFDSVSEIKVGPVYVVRANDVTETYTKRAKNAGEIDAMRVRAVAAVHFEADRRLALTVTATQQVQALTRLVQLLYLHTDTSVWPAGERILVTAMLNRLTSIRDWRIAEDSKVSEVTALTTAAQIAAYDINVGWPA